MQGGFLQTGLHEVKFGLFFGEFVFGENDKQTLFLKPSLAVFYFPTPGIFASSV
jgi:hypothetical protein